MVKAQKSWLYPQHSAWQLPDLNCMNTSLDPRQPESLPTCLNPGNYMLSTNVASPGFALPALEKQKMEKVNGARMLQVLPPRFQTLVPNTCLFKKQPAVAGGLSVNLRPNAMFGSLQKGLFVFDQSGNQTRLIYSSHSPSVLNPPATAQKVVSDHGFPEEKAIGKGQFTSMMPILHEESDDNHISDKECELHEDTEEINALLYSDEDDDYSDDDDEVKSTDHSPVAIEDNCEKYGLIAEMSEEVASSDGPNKRQKLLNGGYSKSSQTEAAFSVQLETSHEFDNDAELSHDSGRTRRKEMGSILSNKREDKIHKTLRILQGIVPNANGKDPMSVLDEAIGYLQSLKVKAMALGV